MSLDFTNDKIRISYALAMNIASSVRRMPVPLDLDVIADNIGDLLKGASPQLPESDFHASMQQLQENLHNAAQAAQQKQGAANAAAEKSFMAENGKRAEVKTTASGLQYEVLATGTGAVPKRDSVVRVHYEGRLLDGRVFDSSIERGEPAEFPVNQVIAGWTEALQLMKEGDKLRLFIPAELGYGERGAGDLIGPNSALIFDVELLNVVK